MLKRRNRVYRRIAVALTVALLAGQSHTFVLAEEDAGGAPQTEVTGEADTSTPDNDSDLDNDSTPDGGNDSQNPDDNENKGDQQGDRDGQDKCICGTKCAADAVNTDCPVCATDYAACVGQADDAGNNGSGSDDTENNDPENGGQENPDGSAESIADGQKCICETVCTEENVNMDCPVCAADYANCAKKAGEGVNLAEGMDLEEVLMEDEEGEALAEEGIEVGDVGYEFDYQGLRYAIIKNEGGIREVKVAPWVVSAISSVVSIPESVECNGLSYRVTRIGAGAFHSTRITSITIPDSVIYIEPSAFRMCANLGSITIPGSVKEIGPEAFRESALKSVTIREGVTRIGNGAFYECHNLANVEIPGSVTSIGEAAFYYCDQIKSVIMQEGVKSIGKQAFGACSGLTSVTIPTSVTTILREAFGGCKSLRSIRLPENITTMAMYVFSECSNLRSITIPNGVTSIEEGAFWRCYGLESVSIPDSVASIGNSAFSSCSSLKSVSIPNSVTKIEPYTFYECTSLNDVIISNNVASIAEMAFYNCKNLDTLQIAILSNEQYQFPAVGENAFTGLPDSKVRNDIIIKKGTGLTDDDLKAADVENAFIEAAKNDGDSDNSTWYGWSYIEVPDVKDSHKVTITVQKDGTQWTDHGRTFALTMDGGTNFVTDLGAVEAGDYEIVDATDSGNKLKTGVGVKVADTDASATVEYYTVAFCYLDDAGNEQTYGKDTDWKPQIVLKNTGRVAVPATNPTKADHIFDKWVTASNEETAFAFETTPIIEKDTKIYAKWTENTVTTYHTVTFYDGTTPYGADTPQKPQSVADGQMADEPEAPQKAGWEFNGWKTTDGGSTTYDFGTPVTGDTDIYASWTKKTVAGSWCITATATEGGSIDPKGKIIVSEGGKRTFTITPGEGNKIKAVTVDDEDVTADLKETRARAQTGARYYTFTNIVKDHTIHAEFESDNGGSGGGGDNPDPGGDNPGGGSGGGGGDNPDSGNDDDGRKPGGGGGNAGGGDNGGGNTNSGGGNNGGGSTNPDGGNGTGNAVNADTGNGAGNGQTVAGITVSSAQAGNGVVAASAGSNTAFDGSKAAGGSTSGVAGTAANGKEPKTGDASYLEVYATLAMIAGLTYLLLYVMEESRGMSEREKEAFVAAFIRWGKKGGAFRKCCAMAAIFCLLAYYHIIGKNVGENALREKHLGQAF